MKALGYIFAALLLMVALFGLGFAIQGSDLFVYRWFAPKYEDARRETFEHSHAYNAGMVQELQNMQMEYLKQTDPAAKDAIASIVLHRVGDYSEDKLPADLYAFVQSLRHARVGAPTTGKSY